MTEIQCIPLKEIPHLIAKLTLSDLDFCHKIAENADNIWAHFRTDCILLREDDNYSPRTIYVVDWAKHMANVKLSHLEPNKKCIILSEPLHITINNEELSFNLVDVSQLPGLKTYLSKRSDITRDHFEWSVKDTGVSTEQAWNVVTKK